MGLFSSKKKRFVETSVVRAIEDEFLPSILREAVVEAVFANRDLMGVVQDQALNGRFRNFERMYRWARTPGNYAYGLPDVNVRSSDEGFALAQAHLENLLGTPIEIEYLHYRPLNNVHAGFEYISRLWDYDESTNTLTVPGEPATGTYYLKKMVALHDTAVGQEPEPSALGVFGSGASAGFTPERPSLDGITSTGLGDLVVGQEVVVRSGPEAVEIHWLHDLDGVLREGFETVDLTNYSEDREYYQAKVRYTDGGSPAVFYWIYDTTTGSDDALNRVFEPADYTSPGSYFPFAVFRSEQENRTENESTPEFQSTAKLLDIIGMDFKEVGESIHENPDIDDIRQAVLLLAVPITTDNEIQVEYLFRYFADIYEKLPPAAQERHPRLSMLTDQLVGNDTSFALQISDADFSLNISFDKITRQLRAGSIGAVGTYTNSQASLQPVQTFVPGMQFQTTTPINGRVRYLRKQITPQVYEEIAIENPRFRYPVNIENKKFVEGGADDERLLIPLEFNICKQINVLKREVLYNRSLNFVFNSYVVQKVKWYETGIFKALLVVVGVVIAFATGPLGATLAAAASAGASALALTVVKLVVGFILKSLVFQFVFTELVQAIGIEAAAILAVAAALLGGVKALQAGELVSGSTAAKLVQAANGLVTGINGAIKDAFGNLVREAELLAEEQEALQEKLSSAQELLGDPLNIDPFVFIGEVPMFIAGEAPDAYFNRTVHSGNVGVASLNIIQNFVDISLRLPSIEETAGDFING